MNNKTYLALHNPNPNLLVTHERGIQYANAKFTQHLEPRVPTMYNQSMQN